MSFYLTQNIRRTLIKGFYTTAFITLTGCTTIGPEFQPIKAELPEKWQLKENANVEINENWWKGFNDPVLDQLINISHQENLSLRESLLRIVEARAILGVTKANNLPRTKFNGSASSTKQSEHASPQPLDNEELFSLGLDSSWEIDFWGKLFRQRESATASYHSLIANHGDMFVTVTAEVASTYISIITLEQRIKLLMENIKLQERSLQIAEVWFNNGGRTELDLRQAQALVHETRSQLPGLEQDLYKKQSALAVLLGTHRSKVLDMLNAGSSVPQYQLPVSLNLPIDLLRRRPDIRASEYLAKMRNADIGVAKADYYPSFSLTGNLGLSVTTGISTLAGGISGSSGGDLFSTEAKQYTGGFGFSWDIFNFGRIENNVLASDARLQQAIESYKMTVLSAVKETEDAMFSLQKAGQQEKALTQSASAYTRASTLSIQQYKDGATDYQSVLDSLRQLVNVKQTQVQAKGQIALNVVSLYKAVGGGWFFDKPIELPQKTIDQMAKRTDWDEKLNNSIHGSTTDSDRAN
ncbi:efflux transporter outer membrane subunit [Pseudoalteromonas phenolica]|uniref:efflux transporter outer membrane subunit n=1 Tax=Pseudoalteromonas phenolica TaxID=161398 RepID=UPI00110A2201|nr:efflux transporter outer membrane subunit [Pseudoalteromonas phenolica]TMO57001.1 transporter [Pseudoalteromonas phenolica]